MRRKSEIKKEERRIEEREKTKIRKKRKREETKGKKH